MPASLRRKSSWGVAEEPAEQRATKEHAALVHGCEQSLACLATIHQSHIAYVETVQMRPS
jgi:hypothetical protein